MINIRTIKKLADGDGLTLKNGKSRGTRVAIR